MQGTETVSISGFSSIRRVFVPELRDLAPNARALTMPTFSVEWRWPSRAAKLLFPPE
jgi:hypothetical protein